MAVACRSAWRLLAPTYMISVSSRPRSIAFRYRDRDRRAEASNISAVTKATMPTPFAARLVAAATRPIFVLVAKSRHSAAADIGLADGSSKESTLG